MYIISNVTVLYHINVNVKSNVPRVTINYLQM